MLHRRQSPHRDLEPSDILPLTVLGAAANTCVSLNDIIALATTIAPQDWRPTVEVVGNGVLNAIDAGLIILVPMTQPGVPVHFSITESGRAALHDLLRRAVPSSCGGPSRACMAAKLCFLECLDPAERSGEVEALTRSHRQVLETLRDRFKEQTASGMSARRWLHHEIERFEWELAWLDRLHADIAKASCRP